MNLFGYDISMKKLAPKLEMVDKRIPSMMVLPWEQGREIYSKEDYQQLINLYESWVYVCASKNADAVAAANIKLYSAKTNSNQKFLVQTKAVDHNRMEQLSKFPHLQPYIRKSQGMVEILEHPIYELFKNVNPITNRFDLWNQTELFLELTGNAFWFTPKNNLGVPDEIWTIPPQYMKIVADKNTLIMGYIFERGTIKIPFEYNEIVHFKFTSPSNQLYGQGPLAAVVKTVAYNESIRRFDDTLMKNMGRPEAVLETTQVIGPDVFKRLKEEWQQNYQGSQKVGKTIILESGLTYKPITFTPKDMKNVVDKKLNREEIAAVFGVPVSKLTTEAVNLANAKVGDAQYQKDTIEPRLRRIEEKLNERFCPMFADNIFLAFESTVPADSEFESAEREKRLKNYLTSVNEERARLGMQSADWGDVPLVPGGVTPLGSQPDMGGGGYPNEPQLFAFTEAVIKNIKKKLNKS